MKTTESALRACSNNFLSNGSKRWYQWQCGSSLPIEALEASVRCTTSTALQTLRKHCAGWPRLQSSASVVGPQGGGKPPHFVGRRPLDSWISPARSIEKVPKADEGGNPAALPRALGLLLPRQLPALFVGVELGKRHRFAEAVELGHFPELPVGPEIGRCSGRERA